MLELTYPEDGKKEKGKKMNTQECECLWEEGEVCGTCEDAATDAMFEGTFGQ